MLFNSYLFLFAFLPATVLLLSILQNLGRKQTLLALIIFSSAIFYGYSSLPHLLIFLASIILNYQISKYCRSSSWWFAFGLAANISLLGVFKYAGFISAELRGTGLDIPAISFVLPLAISFYTFQQMSFLIDSRRGVISRPDFLTYAAYVSFFPQLVAGPIVRFNEVVSRLSRASPFRATGSGFRLGLTLVALGLAKKVLVADYFASIADLAFDDPSLLTSLDAWAGLLAFGLQIYFDFSAYSDIAIGLGMLFGIRLPDNFRSPYQATEIADFWRRWHITLSRFLRDYLYIPLGGNRHGKARTVVNLVIVMSLG